MSNGIPECRQANRWIKIEACSQCPIDKGSLFIMPGGKPTMHYAINGFGVAINILVLHQLFQFITVINYTGSKAVPYDLTEDKDLKFNPDKILSFQLRN